MLKNMDTGKSSIIHRIFPSSPNSNISIFSHFVLPYVSVAFITYGVMFILALIDIPLDNMIKPYQEVKTPFLLDLNQIMMFLITLPILIVFLVTERIIIPDGLGKIEESGVLVVKEIDEEKIVDIWERRYQKLNILGQLVGIIVGILVAYFNYKALFIGKNTFWGNVEGKTYIASWYFIICMFFLFFTVTFFIIRNITNSFLLRSVVSRSKIEIIPFHPDKCGGLEPIGKLGLRNQYLLSFIGLNIVALFLNDFIISDKSNYGLLIVGVVAYLVIGPIGFMGPLLPFRNAMKEDKIRLIHLVADRIKTEFTRVKNQINMGTLSEEDEKKFSRYKKISDMVSNLPVWPFDTHTLRKFFSAYFLPLISGIVSIYFEELIKIIMQP
jgi:hypothetical protein